MVTDSFTEEKNVTLLDLLDRILDRGVVLTGDLTISVADVDLIVVGLRVLLASVDRLEQVDRGSSWPRGRELAHG
ncbi:MAG TPA: gas vesicle protein GvpJ [Ktedonobacterales bacterium]